MDARQLGYFLAVVDHGGVNRAAALRAGALVLDLIPEAPCGSRWSAARMRSPRPPPHFLRCL